MEPNEQNPAPEVIPSDPPIVALESTDGTPVMVEAPATVAEALAPLESQESTSQTPAPLNPSEGEGGQREAEPERNPEAAPPAVPPVEAPAAEPPPAPVKPETKKRRFRLL